MIYYKLLGISMYIPDGSGVWYEDRVCEPYADCCNDDELVLDYCKIIEFRRKNV